MKFRGLFCVVLMLGLMAGGVGAEEMPKEGFSGYIFLGGGYMKGDLALDDAMEEDNQTISSLNPSVKDSSVALPLVSGELNYLFSTKTMVGLNMGVEDGPGIRITQFAGDLGVFSVGGAFYRDDVWKDPYLTGQARSKTDRDVISIYTAWDAVMNTDLSIRYGVKDVDVDEDVAGAAEKDLQRDGMIHSLRVSYPLISKGVHMLAADATGELGDMDGESESFKGGEVGLTHIWVGNSWDLTTGIGYGMRDYDKKHVKFNREREDKVYTAETALTLYRPFGFENYYVSFFGRYEKKDSNIQFYDSSFTMAGMGAGFRF